MVYGAASAMNLMRPDGMRASLKAKLCLHRALHKFCRMLKVVVIGLHRAISLDSDSQADQSSASCALFIAHARRPRRTSQARSRPQASTSFCHHGPLMAPHSSVRHHMRLSQPSFEVGIGSFDCETGTSVRASVLMSVSQASCVRSRAGRFASFVVQLGDVSP